MIRSSNLRKVSGARSVDHRWLFRAMGTIKNPNWADKLVLYEIENYVVIQLKKVVRY